MSAILGKVQQALHRYLVSSIVSGIYLLLRPEEKEMGIVPSEVDLFASLVPPGGIQVEIEGMGSIGFGIVGMSLFAAVGHAYVVISSKIFVGEDYDIELLELTQKPARMKVRVTARSSENRYDGPGAFKSTT